MGDGIIVQHPPAVKVGGRRLSITTRHRSHTLPYNSSPNITVPDNEPIFDYPRPAPPGNEHIHQRILHKDDLPPKREKKQNAYDTDKMKEYALWKSENTRPTRDTSNSRSFGAAGRIVQPAGKGLGL